MNVDLWLKSIKRKTNYLGNNITMIRNIKYTLLYL